MRARENKADFFEKKSLKKLLETLQPDDL